MTLIQISNFASFLNSAIEGPQRLPLVASSSLPFTPALIKFDVHSACEVLGYQLADRLQVPVATWAGFWVPDPVTEVRHPSDAGRVGLALRYHDPFEPLPLSTVAELDPNVAARALVLCAFDRHEWGGFAETDAGPLFFDLERLLPSFILERSQEESWVDVARYLRRAADQYKAMDRGNVLEAVQAAHDLGILDEFAQAMVRVAAVPIQEWRTVFDLAPHPLAPQVTKLAAEAVSRRTKVAMDVMDDA